MRKLVFLMLITNMNKINDCPIHLPCLPRGRNRLNDLVERMFVPPNEDFGRTAKRICAGHIEHLFGISGKIKQNKRNAPHIQDALLGIFNKTERHYSYTRTSTGPKRPEGSRGSLFLEELEAIGTLFCKRFIPCTHSFISLQSGCRPHRAATWEGPRAEE